MIALPFRRIRWLPNRASVASSLLARFPRTYLALACLTALPGYLFLIMFPLLVIAGIINIADALVSSEAINWTGPVIWFVVASISGLVGFRSLQGKPAPPPGLTLTEDKAPELFALVQRLSRHYKRPAIHRITVTGNYELDIVKTPRWAWPVWMSNTLVVGLPVMQSLSPVQFECMVARRIGQFSMQHNVLTNWLYQLRTIWPQYRALYRGQKGIGFEPLKWFFAVYTPFYLAVTRHAARQDEYSADTYAMELYNDEQVREMITADSLCRWYLRNQYWPAVYKAASGNPKNMPSPHARIASAVYVSLNGDRLQSLMKKVIRHKPSPRATVPSLQNRIENIGHDKARMGQRTTETAAAHYLGASMKNVIALIDRLWQQNLLQGRKRQHRQKPQQPSTKQAAGA